jgi:hypothetical protein
MIDIDIVWRRLKQHEGEEFRTVRGLVFTYSFRNEQFVPSRTNYQIAKSNFVKAFDLYPFKKVSDIGNIVRGGSYVFAVLTDDRIRKTDW